MADLVLEIPERLYDRLVRRAEANRVTLRNEVLLCLNRIADSPIDDSDLLNSSAEVEVTL